MAGIHGTSLPTTSTTSASASTGFWPVVFHWYPRCSGWSAGKFIRIGADSITPTAASSHSSVSAATAAVSRPR